MREKCQLMQKHNDDLEHRDTEIESSRIASKQKEQEKAVLRQRLEEAQSQIDHL